MGNYYILKVVINGGDVYQDEFSCLTQALDYLFINGFTDCPWIVTRQGQPVAFNKKWEEKNVVTFSYVRGE